MVFAGHLFAIQFISFHAPILRLVPVLNIRIAPKYVFHCSTPSDHPDVSDDDVLQSERVPSGKSTRLVPGEASGIVLPRGASEEAWVCCLPVSGVSMQIKEFELFGLLFGGLSTLLEKIIFFKPL